VTKVRKERKTVPIIPTPFIGGSDSPRRDTEKQDRLAPPFVPEAAEHEDDSPGRVDREVAPTGEPEPPLTEQVIPIEVSEDEGVDQTAREGPAFELEELIREELAGPELLVASTEAAPAEEESSSAAPTAPDSEDFVPDWLVSSDIAAEEDEGEAQPKPTTFASATELAARAAELQQGEWADWIRALIAELGPYAAEVAIARAFAAGHIAATTGEGNE
jgi:hypothetical protein